MACSIARSASPPLLPEVACSTRRQSSLELIFVQKERASDRVVASPKRFSISEASSRAIFPVGPESILVRSSSSVQLRRDLPVWVLRLMAVSDASLNTGTSSIKRNDVKGSTAGIMNSCDCESMDARLSNVNPSGTERRSSCEPATERGCLLRPQPASPWLSLHGSKISIAQRPNRTIAPAAVYSFQIIWTGPEIFSQAFIGTAFLSWYFPSHQPRLGHFNGESFLERVR